MVAGGWSTEKGWRKRLILSWVDTSAITLLHQISRAKQLQHRVPRVERSGKIPDSVAIEEDVVIELHLLFQRDWEKRTYLLNFLTGQATAQTSRPVWSSYTDNFSLGVRMKSRRLSDPVVGVYRAKCENFCTHFSGRKGKDASRAAVALRLRVSSQAGTDKDTPPACYNFRDRCIIKTLWWLGRRRHELVQLDIRNFGFVQTVTVHHSKEGKTKTFRSSTRSLAVTCACSSTPI
jgi:hypothetical protein